MGGAPPAFTVALPTVPYFIRVNSLVSSPALTRAAAAAALAEAAAARPDAVCEIVQLVASDPAGAYGRVVETMAPAAASPAPVASPAECPVATAAFHAAPINVETVPLAGDDAAADLAADLAALATAARFARADALRTGNADALPDVLDRIHHAAADAVADACGGFPGSDACVVAVPDGMVGICGLLQGAAVSYVSRDNSFGQTIWLASREGRPANGCPDAATAVAVAAGLTEPPASARRRRNRAAATGAA